MQACINRVYGSPDVVQLGELPKPAMKSDQVLVRVRATSVTTADWRLRTATFPRVFRLPGRLWLGLTRPRKQVLGMDFSGVVEAVGSAVTRFRVGERVFGSTSAGARGAHAEYVAVEEAGAITHTPAELDDEAAAAVPFGANCALQFLRDFGRLRAGQRVLIVGASGGVGVWAVQLARHLGAHVTGVCSTNNLELVRSLGAHEVIDYTEQPGFLGRESSYDLVFDTVGATTFQQVRPILSERGVYLPLNNDLREIIQAALTSLAAGKRLKVAVSQNTRASLEANLVLIRSGALRPVIDRVYTLPQIADAHRHVESRHRKGSVIVRVAAA